MGGWVVSGREVPLDSLDGGVAAQRVACLLGCLTRLHSASLIRCCHDQHTTLQGCGHGGSDSGVCGGRPGAEERAADSGHGHRWPAGRRVGTWLRLTGTVAGLS